MTVVNLDQAPVFTSDGFTFRPLAVPSRGSTDLAIWRVDAAPAAISVEHSMSREEVFISHTIGLHVTMAGEEYRLAPGDALTVPPNTRLVITNPSPDTIATFTAVTSVGMLGTIGDNTFAPPWAQ
ncbi:hypothetical protein [Nocardia sp. NPDC056000]|uniref:hypothetical protein n=1 Tax=Nocardia sp. NPDC056000 TaxID=3345674 RepID=UPI0035DD1B26